MNKDLSHLSIAIVEDDPLTRLTVAETLRSRGASVVVEAAAAAAALAADVHFDVALLDLHLGAGPTGLDVAHALRASRPDVGVVFLTSFDDPRLLGIPGRSLPAGSQYLTKTALRSLDTLAETLLSSVEAARNGTAGTFPSSGQVHGLTDIQVEVLRLVAQGLTNAEIARRRFVTEKSVEVAVARLAATLGLARRPDHNQRVHVAQVFFRSTGVSIVDVEG